MAFNQLVGGSNPPRPTTHIPLLHTDNLVLRRCALQLGFEPAVHFLAPIPAPEMRKNDFTVSDLKASVDGKITGFWQSLRPELSQ